MARDAWRGVVGWLEAQRVAGAQRVQLGVRASNEGARRFYGALGFDEVGVRPRYDTDAEDAVLWLPGSA
jgi:ribosomal protein S18 acetylase RimI-like enzyme